ncbi:Serine/threonine-protein kinase/endoribonuclease IRE1b, partial [Ananas comosus]
VFDGMIWNITLDKWQGCHFWSAHFNELGIIHRDPKPQNVTEALGGKHLNNFFIGTNLFYCITEGRHLFGDHFEQDMNILDNHLDLFSVDYIPEVALCHTLFWSSEMLLSFIWETSDRIDKAIGSNLLIALKYGTICIWQEIGQKFGCCAHCLHGPI